MPRHAVGFLQRTAKNTHRIAARRQIQQPAGNGSHAKINIAGSNGNRHRLRRLKRHQLGIQPLGGVIALFLGDKTGRMRRQGDIADLHLVRRLRGKRRYRQNRRQRGAQHSFHKTSGKKPRNHARGRLFNIAVRVVQAAAAQPARVGLGKMPSPINPYTAKT